MAWTCPDCGKKFKNTNQAHSCDTFPPSYLLDKASENIQELFNALLDKVRGFGPFDCYSNKTEISFRTDAVFMAVRLQKEKLQIIFYLDHMDCDPPIIKNFDVSKQRVLHQVEISSPEEIDGRLLFLLTQSYDLFSGPEEEKSAYP